MNLQNPSQVLMAMISVTTVRSRMKRSQGVLPGAFQDSFDFAENQPPILGKSVADFGEMFHQFCGNPSPILGKSVTDFGEICHRFWENV